MVGYILLVSVRTHPLCVDTSNRFALLVRHTKLGEVGPCFQGTARVRVMTTENKVTLSCWSVTILSASDYVGPATGPPLGLAHFVQYVPRGKSHRKKKQLFGSSCCLAHTLRNTSLRLTAVSVKQTKRWSLLMVIASRGDWFPQSLSNGCCNENRL